MPARARAFLCVREVVVMVCSGGDGGCVGDGDGGGDGAGCGLWWYVVYCGGLRRFMAVRGGLRCFSVCVSVEVAGVGGRWFG